MRKIENRTITVQKPGKTQKITDNFLKQVAFKRWKPTAALFDFQINTNRHH